MAWWGHRPGGPGGLWGKGLGGKGWCPELEEVLRADFGGIGTFSVPSGRQGLGGDGGAVQLGLSSAPSLSPLSFLGRLFILATGSEVPATAPSVESCDPELTGLSFPHPESDPSSVAWSLWVSCPGLLHWREPPRQGVDRKGSLVSSWEEELRIRDKPYPDPSVPWSGAD